MYQFPFRIYEPIGNNFFSFEARKEKSIYIPSLAEGNIGELEKSREFALIEVEDGVEKASVGVKHFIRQGNIFVFDNHNHCYYFYKRFLRNSGISSSGFLHVDQHKDLREPEMTFEEFCSFVDIKKELSAMGIGQECLEQIKNCYKQEEKFSAECLDFLYANRVLNVGNFIKPLVAQGKISELAIIDSEYSMKNFSFETFASEYVLDLDLDFFSKDLNYIDHKSKIDFVRMAVEKAQAIFIATSPYFISFEEAKKALEEIFFV